MTSHAAGTLAVTMQASGEIRVALRIPRRTSKRPEGALGSGQLGAGCAALVYSEKSRDLSAKRPGFGAVPKESVFGSAAKRGVKNACGALKSVFNKKIVFGTLTLAGSTDDARKALAAWSGKCVDLINHWRTDKAPNSLWVYKWEWQKSGALHLHFAIGSESIMELRSLEQSFQGYAHKLHETISRLAGVDIFERSSGGSWRGLPQVLRSRIEPVRKCVKRYMAKYLIKGAGAVASYHPSSWWGQSRRLLEHVRRLTSYISVRSADWESLAQKLVAVEQLVYTKVRVRYAYQIPYSATSRVVLLYPDEADTLQIFSTIYFFLTENIHTINNQPV